MTHHPHRHPPPPFPPPPPKKTADVAAAAVPLPADLAAAQPSAPQQADQVWPGTSADDVSAQVAATKAEVSAAARDPAAAFDAYLSEHLAAYNETVAAGETPSPAQRALAPLLASSAARQGRQAVFASNLRKIAAYNRRSGDDLAYGITGFAHLTPQEFKAAYLKPFAPMEARIAPTTLQKEAAAASGARLPGAAVGEEGPLGVPYECDSEVAFPYGGTTPPAAKDWRSIDGVSYVTDVRSQASCGSCASFAATAALETHVAWRYATKGFTAANVDLSEQDHLECTEGDQCEGWLPSYYLDRAVCRGVVFEAESPYEGKDTDNCRRTQRYLTGLKGFATVPGNELALAQAVNQAPVAIAMAANSAFQFYKGGAFPCASDSTGINHAITVVGWNDAALMKSGETWKVWYIKNSWGKTWGPNGYVLMRKDCKGTGSLKMYTSGYNVVPVSRGEDGGSGVKKP